MLKREVATVEGKEHIDWKLAWPSGVTETLARPLGELAEAAYRMGFNDGCAKGIADSAAYEARRDG